MAAIHATRVIMYVRRFACDEFVLMFDVVNPRGLPSPGISVASVLMVEWVRQFFGSRWPLTYIYSGQIFESDSAAAGSDDDGEQIDTFAEARKRRREARSSDT